ncbi:hypothetical protein [Blastococcus brunescens]|uniref:RCK C-terminal domain-containing protein n=1 Tax=Blastococcus brunescens TaxID=1564165 RepID=A0ABZ1AT43_9ACTN|nr:hypothetical protein [Blastococcus sp. BMG 8361]WRL61738.1 hypothetical protein U6N30_16530 [Blastococcus sp. BMG 8361]
MLDRRHRARRRRRPLALPGDPLRAGDVVVAIGSSTGLEQLERRLAGRSDG